MGQVSPKFRRWEHEGRAGLHYWCQGCEEIHGVVIEGPGSWGFNGDLAAPTFTPSVLVRSGHYSPGQEGKPCWCDYKKAHPDETDVFNCTSCHTFITGGMVQFLSDCSHALAGQTLPLPDLPADHQD